MYVCEMMIMMIMMIMMTVVMVVMSRQRRTVHDTQYHTHTHTHIHNHTHKMLSFHQQKNKNLKSYLYEIFVANKPHVPPSVVMSQNTSCGILLMIS